MRDVNLLTVAVAAIVVVLGGWIYYGVLGAQLADVSVAAAAGAGTQPPPWKLAIELLRSLILATVVAGLASHADIDEPGDGVALGLALWIGFPVVLWTGAMSWESTPP